MDFDYFKDQICEELDGSIAYIRHALEIKAMSPSWAKTLVDMSEAEMNHAKNLYKMFEEYYAKVSEKYDTVPKYIESYMADISECYSEKVMKIDHLHKMYNM